MIRYRLNCRKGHEFEGWFASSAAFDRQAKQGRVTLPDLRHQQGHARR